MIATTPMVNETAENLTITVEIFNQTTDTGFLFEYRPNPNVTDIQPRDHVIGYALPVLQCKKFSEMTSASSPCRLCQT